MVPKFSVTIYVLMQFSPFNSAVCEPIVYKMWDSRCFITLWASTACYRDSFSSKDGFLWDIVMCVNRSASQIVKYVTRLSLAPSPTWSNIRFWSLFYIKCTCASSDCNFTSKICEYFILKPVLWTIMWSEHGSVLLIRIIEVAPYCFSLSSSLLPALKGLLCYFVHAKAYCRLWNKHCHPTV
jgi:hypothetical protein